MGEGNPERDSQPKERLSVKSRARSIDPRRNGSSLIRV
jgi:hypothetical protein